MPQRAQVGDRRTRKGGVYEKLPTGRWKRVAGPSGDKPKAKSGTPGGRSKTGSVRASKRANAAKKKKAAALAVQKKKQAAQNKRAQDSVRKAQQAGRGFSGAVGRLERAARKLEGVRSKHKASFLDVSQRKGPPPLGPALKRHKAKLRLKKKREREAAARLRKEEAARPKGQKLTREAPVERPIPKKEGARSKFSSWAKNAWNARRRR